jgi:hypothetical protein
MSFGEYIAAGAAAQLFVVIVVIAAVAFGLGALVMWLLS